jgi:hypothetical protein
MATMTTRPQWPHTIDDIVKSLDGIWGLVGATGDNGNLFRLERSLHQPVVYTLTEFRGDSETDIVNKKVFPADKKQEAVSEFARAIGFTSS